VIIVPGDTDSVRICERFQKEVVHVRTLRPIWLRKRFVALLALVGVLALSVASTASANPPTVQPFIGSGTATVSGLCSFDVSVTFTFNGTERDFTDRNGNLTRIELNFTEQDTFSANGHQLVGEPFRNIQRVLFDSNGNVTHVYETGVIERIPLPDGGRFLSAGRLDFVAHPGEVIVITPDHGLSGDIEGFCAALAP